MKIQPKVLVIAFVLSTAAGALSNSHPYITLYFTEFDPRLTVFTVISVLTYLINPLLVFVSFYFVGKEIQTNREFYSYLLSLYVGNATGLFLDPLLC